MVRTTELLLKCPDVKNQADAIIVRDMLMAAPGVGDVEVDWSTGTVRVLTANQDAGLDVIARLSASGYPPVSDEREYLRESG